MDIQTQEVMREISRGCVEFIGARIHCYFSGAFFEHRAKILCEGWI